MLKFIDRLAKLVQTKGNGVCVGLDPRFESLPKEMQTGRDHGHGQRAAAYAEFCKAIIDVVCPLVPVVKPQSAFFEALGPDGMSALAGVISHATSKTGAEELLVILDGKRNDIGSTAQAYAEAYLGRNSPWGADALTVSPYLGDDSLEPFAAACDANGAGIFVLVKTSNPGGGDFQDQLIQQSAGTLYQRVADVVEARAKSTSGECEYGDIGAVVGATYPEQLAELRQAMPHTWFLVPGYGAQGGGAADVAAAFDKRGLGAVVNSSRGIIFAHNKEPYKTSYGESRWQDAVRAATEDMIRDLRSALPHA
ncbi:MAG: orotidine-5'-phosphate decarboxylase [Pirellulales bacterium]|nr:orotidine-5'-phosphate decarboxylase [Pirellulales bacterium]